MDHHTSEAPPGEPLLIPYPFRLGERVTGPGVRGAVTDRRGPYSVAIRLDTTGRTLISTTLDLVPETEPAP